MATAEQIAEMKMRMDAEWEKYHWVRETHEDDELAAIIDEEGSVDAALKDARETTKLLDEQASEARSAGEW
jgi:hypothetical protein